MLQWTKGHASAAGMDNDHDFAAMCRLHATSNHAITSQSTFSRLFECLQPSRISPHCEPKLGLVNYVDHKNEMVPQNVPFRVFVRECPLPQEAKLLAVIQEFL